jgi:hypothetical protein
VQVQAPVLAQEQVQAQAQEQALVLVQEPAQGLVPALVQALVREPAQGLVPAQVQALVPALVREPAPGLVQPALRPFPAIAAAITQRLGSSAFVPGLRTSHQTTAVTRLMPPRSSSIPMGPLRIWSGP